MKIKWRFLFVTIFLITFCTGIITGQDTRFYRHSEQQRLANGKYVCKTVITATENDNPVEFNLVRRESRQENHKYLSKPGNPKQNYHIKFTFNALCESFYCIGADTTFSAFWNMTWTGNNTVEADMPEGYYMICGEFSKNYAYDKDTLFLIYQKDFHVYKDLDTTISTASAIHDLFLEALDENGTHIQNPLKSGDGFGIINELSDEYIIDYTAAIHMGNFNPAIKISGTNPGVKILFSRTNVLNKEDYHQYLISYPALMNIDSDTTLTNVPEDMKHFPFVYHPSPSFDDSYFAFGFGSVANDSLTGTVDTFVGASITTQYPGKSDTIQVHVYGPACDTNKAFFAALVDHRECEPVTLCSLHDIFGPIFYLDPSGPLILSSNGNYPPVEGDYHAQNESVATFGTTSPFNVTWNYTEPGSWLINIMQHFKGQTNERRNCDMMSGTWDIWQGNQHQWHDSITYYSITYGVPSLGLYTLVLNDSNYIVTGKPGYLRIEMDMDVGGPDPASPTLQAFKIMTGDSICSEVIKGYPASIKLTAADLTHLPPDFTRCYHSLADARLYMKAYDDTPWIELLLVSQNNLLDSLCGMPYYADIAQSLSRFPDSTFVDFKVELVDSAGNATIQVMHPACMVRDAIVGIDPSPPGKATYIFPNPVKDILSIHCAETEIATTVFSVTGQVIVTTTDSRSIDFSGKNPGIYVVRVIGHQSGKVSCFKIVR